MQGEESRRQLLQHRLGHRLRERSSLADRPGRAQRQPPLRAVPLEQPTSARRSPARAPSLPKPTTFYDIPDTQEPIARVPRDIVSLMSLSPSEQARRERNRPRSSGSDQ